MVAEERLVAELLGMVGELEAAREMLDRALATCERLRERVVGTEQASWKDLTLTAAEHRALAVQVQRLDSLANAIARERKGIFGSPVLPRQARLVSPSTARNAPGPPSAQRGKRRFGFRS